MLHVWPPSEKAAVYGQIETWFQEKVVHPSISDYASPIVLVKKKDGFQRMCVDYRILNEKVVKVRYLLPVINDRLDSLRGANVFTTLDLKNGFFHVSIEDAD